jgi:hypothetical protein
VFLLQRVWVQFGPEAEMPMQGMATEPIGASDRREGLGESEVRAEE